MRLVKRSCFVLFVVCVALFALLNPHSVRLNLLFLPSGFRLPLSVLLTGVFFAGFLLGSAAGLLRRRGDARAEPKEKSRSTGSP